MDDPAVPLSVISRQRTRLASAAVLGACLVAGLLGCGDQERRSGGGEVKVGSTGRLLADPEPLTLADVNRQPPSSPERTVWRMIFWAQWGNPANTLAQYDELARDRLGAVSPSSFDWLRPTLVKVQPRIIEVVPTEEGVFVGLEFLSKILPPKRESLVLRRARDGQWKVLYDTFINSGLIQYGISNPTGKGEGPVSEERERTDRASLSIQLVEAREAGRREAQRRRSRRGP